MAFGSYEVGVIQRTPVPNLLDLDHATLSKWSRRAWSLKRALDTVDETSHAFILPFDLKRLDTAATETEIASIQNQIDDEAFRLYGISEADRASIEAPAAKSVDGEADQEEDDEEEEDEDDEAAPRAEAFPLLACRWPSPSIRGSRRGSGRFRQARALRSAAITFAWDVSRGRGARRASRRSRR
ncbi:MAG: hypothetical protein R3A48_03985 [Polyangiales bacterium]